MSGRERAEEEEERWKLRLDGFALALAFVRLIRRGVSGRR